MFFSLTKENEIRLSFIFKLNKTNPTILTGDFKPSKQFFKLMIRLWNTGIREIKFCIFLIIIFIGDETYKIRLIAELLFSTVF